MSQFDEFDPLQLALMRLLERLEIASVYFEEGDQRTSTQGALRAIIEFLRSISGFSESHLAPFRKLLSASAPDLDEIMAAVSVLEGGLKQADEQYRGPNQRIGVLYAINSTNEFILSISRLKAYAGPFLKLLNAVGDLEEGTIPEIFRVTGHGPGRPTPMDDQMVWGLAACAMQILMDLKYPKPEASKSVAKKLQSLGIPLGNSGNQSIEKAAGTVAHWRDITKKGDRDNDLYAMTYYGVLPEIRGSTQARLKAGEGRNTIRRDVLDWLGENCREAGAASWTAEIE